jgi:hypothetical protein
MLNEYRLVQYKNKEYKVCKCKDDSIYVIDADITLPSKTFYNTKVGYISCRLKEKPAYLHHLVMDFVFDGKLYVEHINRIKTDNRRENLTLVTQSAQNKNQTKRTRNVVLPTSINIKVEDIPTFMWYIKPDKSHGDRWAVEIKGKYFWKTTSSKNISTKCKFEIAKKHLRILLERQPQVFDGHSMNGDLQTKGHELELSFYEILKIAGIVYQPRKIETKNLLKEDLNGLTITEQNIVVEYSI